MNAHMETSFVINHQGTNLYCEISPCSWMYASYGLQVSVGLRKGAFNIELEFLHDKKQKWDNDDPTYMLTKAEELVMARIKRGGLIALLEENTRKLRKLESECKEEHAKEEKRVGARLAQLKKKGYTHRLVGWIHPRSGDDIHVDFAFKGIPNNAAINAALRGCTMKTDYRIVEL